MSINISIENLKCGMVVDEQIINKYNQIIIEKGTVIEEKHLRILKIWGIKNLLITEANKNNNISEKPKENTFNKVLRKIKWTPENEIEEELNMLFNELLNNNDKNENK